MLPVRDFPQPICFDIQYQCYPEAYIDHLMPVITLHVYLLLMSRYDILESQYGTAIPRFGNLNSFSSQPFPPSIYHSSPFTSHLASPMKLFILREKHQIITVDPCTLQALAVRLKRSQTVVSPCQNGGERGM